MCFELTVVVMFAVRIYPYSEFENNYLKLRCVKLHANSKSSHGFDSIPTGKKYVGTMFHKNVGNSPLSDASVLVIKS
jgi:hypothetical protein